MNTTKDTLTYLLGLDPADHEDRGAIRALATSADASTPAGRQFAKLVNELLAGATPRERPTRHQEVPWADVRPSREGEPVSDLGQADIAWLGRLGPDPAKVPVNDARALAQLAANVAPGSGAQRLVESYFAPVRRHHEAAVTDANRRVVRETLGGPPPPIPAAAHNLLADAIAAETEGLRPSEADARAREAITAAADARRQRHAGRLHDAEQRAAQPPALDREQRQEQRRMSTWWGGVEIVPRIP